MGGITGILILIIVVLIFTGRNKLPAIGEGLGQTIRNFKRSLLEPDEIDVTPKDQRQDQSKNQPKDQDTPPRQ